ISKEIECAALDVTDPEPLDKNSPLWELENCFIKDSLKTSSNELKVNSLMQIFILFLF
ncbi:MAG TPA: hypothetical protein EYM94_03450, partial [Gammaproteobacteria bacterium]|nr:hypothetical protein [Gammaproteobacteria bacterium]